MAHAEILEFVKPTLEEEGIKLEIETYSDYVIPNVALHEEDLDANYFQHIPRSLTRRLKKITMIS